MATLKKAASIVAPDDYLKELRKSGALLKGTDPGLGVRRISTGLPQLDEILGGGFAYGRNVLVVGPESTGKSLLLQHAIAQVQKDGHNAVLIDCEQSYVNEWWAMSGVDLDRLHVLQPTNGEEAVNAMVAFASSPTENIGLIGLDSIATMSPAVVQEKEAQERSVAQLASLVTRMYEKIMPLNRAVLGKQFVFYAINQLRDNQNGYEDVFPGGRAQRFNSHIRIHTRRVEWLKENDHRVGYIMELHARKNKLGAPEGMCQVSVRFKSQFDLVDSYVNEAIERGLIRSAGAWYYIGPADTKDEEKFLGKQNLRERFASPEALEWLKSGLGER